MPEENEIFLGEGTGERGSHEYILSQWAKDIE